MAWNRGILRDSLNWNSDLLVLQGAQNELEAMLSCTRLMRKNANECNKDVRELLRFDVSCCWSWAFFRFFASPAKSTPHHFTPSNDNCYLPNYTCGMLKSSGSQSFLKFMSSSDL
jgi:hypothetical protein